MTETKKKQAHQVTSTLRMPQLSIQQGATVLCIYVHMHMHAHTHTNTHMKFTVNIKKKKWGLGARDKYIQTCKSWRLRKHDWEKCRKQRTVLEAEWEPLPLSLLTQRNIYLSLDHFLCMEELKSLPHWKLLLSIHVLQKELKRRRENQAAEDMIYTLSEITSFLF